MTRVRRLATCVTVTAIAAVTAPASAAAGPSISVSPRTAGLDERVTVTGRAFTVFESCSRRVSVRLRSAQNAVRLGSARVRRSGRVAFRFVAEDHNVGPGRWRVVVSQRCESGKDGSRFFLRASARLRLRAQPTRDDGS